MTDPLLFPPSFLQSPEWEQVQRAAGRTTWRAGGALVIRHDLPLGFSYLYCPRPNAGTMIWDDITKIAVQEKSIFLKVDPVVPFQAPIPDWIGDKFQVQASDSIQPRETVIIDLAKSEEELLAAMRPKTRYNIRLAERKGVRIMFQVPSSKFQELAVFWRLVRETAARDGFRAHPRGYYEKLLAVRSDAFSNELFFGEYRGEIIAAALVNFYTPTSNLQPPTSDLSVATYLHGASAREYREVMAPHLLHWRILQEAKRRGCVAYDLWGIDAEQWPGLTRFKKAFGGRVLIHPASVDMIYRAGWYRLYSLWKRFS